MPTNDEVEEVLDTFVNDPEGFESSPGSVDMDLSVKHNIGNYENIKFTLGINEMYTGRAGDTREDKVEELFKYIESKLVEKLVTLDEEVKPLIKELTKKCLDNGGKT